MNKKETLEKLESYLKERFFSLDRKLTFTDVEALPITIVACTDLKYESFFMMYENEAYKIPTDGELFAVGKALNTSENDPVVCFVITAHVIKEREILKAVGITTDGCYLSAKTYIGRDTDNYIRLNKNIKASKNQEEIKKFKITKMLEKVIEGYKS